MKTESILEFLKFKYHHSEPYSEYELAEISNLTIKRFDMNRDVLPVKFDDLRNFKALTTLTINSCVIDKKVVAEICHVKTLSTLILINCSLANNAKKELRKSTIRNLVIDNGEVDVECAEGIFLDSLKVSGQIIKNNIKLNANTIDLSKCDAVNKYIFYNEYIEKLIISEWQYSQDMEFFHNLNKYVKIMENNGQFLYKELIADGGI